MIPITVALAVLTTMTLAAVVLAVTAVYHARVAVRASARPVPPDTSALESAVQSMRAGLDGLAAQVHALQEIPAPSAAATLPLRNGMNLAKRSQALRLHRHGNPAVQIASTLQIPVQEVELLLKVHNIVISNLPN